MIGDAIVNALKSKIKSHQKKKADEKKASDLETKKTANKKPATTAKPLSKEVQAKVMAAHTQPEVVLDRTPKEPVKRPYILLDTSNPKVKRGSETGEFIHPNYKFGDEFIHTGEKHNGTVRYVATYNKDGSPVVQPVDEKGINSGISFQANHKNLTEK